MTDPSSPRVRLRGLPQLGARVPGFVPRVAVAVVGVLLCLDRFSGAFWLPAGIVVAVAAAVFPRSFAAWLLVLLLAGNQALRGSEALDWHFFALLAGLHLLHVLAAQTLVLPVRSWVQLDLFRRPLLRYLAIQLPAQAVAVLAMLLLSPAAAGGLALPAIGIAGAVALVVVALVLALPLLRGRARSGAAAGDGRQHS